MLGNRVAGQCSKTHLARQGTVEAKSGIYMFATRHLAVIASYAGSIGFE